MPYYINCRFEAAKVSLDQERQRIRERVQQSSNLLENLRSRGMAYERKSAEMRNDPKALALLEEQRRREIEQLFEKNLEKDRKNDLEKDLECDLKKDLKRYLEKDLEECQSNAQNNTNNNNYTNADNARQLCSVELFIQGIVDEAMRPSSEADRTKALRRAREAFGKAVAKEFSQISDYRVSGGNPFSQLVFYTLISGHICLEQSIMTRLLGRMANQLDLDSNCSADQSSLVNLLAETVTAVHFKSAADLFRRLERAAASAARNQAGQQMLMQLARINPDRSTGSPAAFVRLVAFDLEAYEYNNQLLLELGLSIYEPSVACKIRTRHFILSEHSASLRNGRLIPDHRDNFTFGRSERASLREAHAALCEALAVGSGPVAIVGHGIRSDFEMLGQARLPALPSVDQILDTQTIYLQLIRSSSDETCTSRLETVLEWLQIEPLYLHNAGNDAHYTMLACLRMAGIKDAV